MNQFILPKKLYGRKRELKILQNTFKHITKGDNKLLFVSGYSGIGKSFLVNESKKYLNNKNSFFISGKFDQFKRNVPYKGIIQAFQELINCILNESNSERTVWKNRILKNLGPNAQIIINMIPELELLIGKQPDIPELGPIENQNRFMMYFQKFVSVFSNFSTLIIFIDDLQWADLASLTLLEYLLNNDDKESFLIIGAYRHNEVTEKHPLLLIIDKLKKEKISIIEILLNPLKLNDLKDLISEILPSRNDELPLLTKLIYNKTGGNPFFVNEFLMSLYNSKLLVSSNLGINKSKSMTINYWDWNFKKIEKLPVTKNVGELIINKIKKLSAKDQKLITFCACIGSRFDLASFALILNKSEIDVIRLLSPIIKEEIIYFADGYYIFTHDTVQAAAYSLASDSEKMKNHYKIAEVFFNKLNGDELENKLFYITDQFNSCLNIIEDENEKSKIIELNLRSGIKAKEGIAYDGALKYFKIGIKLLGENCWVKKYKLTLRFYTEAAEAAYLNNEYEILDEYYKIVMENAENLLDKVNMFEIKIQAYIAQNKQLSAIDLARNVLKQLRVNIPKKSNIFDLLFRIIEVKILLRGKTIKHLISFPEIIDRNMIAAVKIMFSIGTAAYWAMPDLVPILVFKALTIASKYGNHPDFIYYYTAYGLVLCGFLNDINTGYKYAETALILLKKLKQKKLTSKVYLMVSIFIKHWKIHIRDTLPLLIEGHQIGIETGDFEYSAVNALFYCAHLFFSGENLNIVNDNINKYFNIIKNLGQLRSYNNGKLDRQVVLNLLGKSRYQDKLIGESFDEEKMMRILTQKNDESIIGTMYIFKSFLSYLFCKYNDSLNYSFKAKKYVKAHAGLYHVVLQNFYYSLSLIAVFSNASIFKKIKYLIIIKNNQKKLKKWAEYAPMNHLHKYYLVEAELMGLRKKDIKVMVLYESAIKLSKENKYVNEEALANELTFKYCLKKNRIIDASMYFKQAYLCYKKWGAQAKLKHLIDTYPDFND